MSNWIVVVDDDVINLKMARTILSEHGMKVTALKSGKQFLSFMENNTPDLVLLDLIMPDMDGFQTYEAFRRREKELGRPRTPVIFVTAETDSEAERRGLELGASDYIKKPFNPDVLLRRIENITHNSEKIKGLAHEATIDQLTGFLNKSGVTAKLEKICRTEKGALMILDLDSFKPVNDIYGHDMGDKMLKAFADLVRRCTRSEDIIGRVGGDEFVCFCHKVTDEEIVQKLIRRMNEQIPMEAKKLMGSDCNIPLGVSAGTVIVSGDGGDYEELFKQADKALLFIKQNGKHGYALYDERDDSTGDTGEDPTADMERLSLILDERSEASSALWLGQDAFVGIYRFMIRFIQTYHGVASKAMFTLKPRKIEYRGSTLNNLSEQFGDMLKNTLRKSDLMMQTRTNQFFILFPELASQYINNVAGRILKEWDRLGYSDVVDILYDFEVIDCTGDQNYDRRGSDNAAGRE